MAHYMLFKETRKTMVLLLGYTDQPLAKVKHCGCDDLGKEVRNHSKPQTQQSEVERKE